MPAQKWRVSLVVTFLCLLLLGILWRLIDLNLINRSFLLQQSRARILRVVDMPAHRGMITDRTGSLLALSTPVYSVWVNPQYFEATKKQVIALAGALKMTSKQILHRTHQKNREFVYLKRRNSPAVMQKINALKIPGLHFQMEYKRFYPKGEVTAHVVGLTNVDDKGQEGLELTFNQWLSGVPGKREVVRDRLGHVVADIAMIKKPQEGRNLTLSIDHRIQYLAYRALKKQVQKLHASAGSVVVLDVKTGEILAMVNQPSYNPNAPGRSHNGNFRNRAVTDSFEPGSTMKPFTIALALKSDKYKPDTIVDTSPGRMKVGGYVIKDDGLDYGKINLEQILQKSSNIGAAKIMLSLEPELFWNLLQNLGFGHRTHSGFPGESRGRLVSRTIWYPSDVATLAYGYGIAVTTLQLAKAYAILANHGLMRPVSFLKVAKPVQATPVMKASVADKVVDMLESVVEKGGTGTRASVSGYRVAGKTGTAYISNGHGYDKHRHVASFVGLAPVSNPRLVVAVVVRDPKKRHFGGLAAAPVFAKVMGGALRILDVSPDRLNSKKVHA